jgi:hypothetical protein
VAAEHDLSTVAADSTRARASEIPACDEVEFMERWNSFDR